MRCGHRQVSHLISVRDDAGRTTPIHCRRCFSRRACAIAHFDDTGYRLAATALLIHVISLDGEPSELEKRKLHSLLESHFGLDPGTADQLIASATLVEGEAVDLYHFTSVIMRSVNEEGRLRIVEMMWELVYADGQVSEFEDNVVWRAADLLGVSSRDRIDLKHRVAATATGAGQGRLGYRRTRRRDALPACRRLPDMTKF